MTAATGFNVDADEIGAFAELVIRNYGHLLSQPGDDYRGTFGQFSVLATKVDLAEEASAVLLIASPRMDHLREQALTGIKRAQTFLQCSHSDLAWAAKFYADKDRATAERLDGMYPVTESYQAGGKRVGRHQYVPGEITQPGTAGRFNDVTDPEVWTKKPFNVADTVDPYRQVTQKIGELDKYFSVSGAVRAIVQGITGVDIFAKVEEVFAGDWNHVGALGLALGYTGGMLDDVATNIRRGLYALQDSWGGHAADAMATMFQQYLDQGLTQHARFCRAAGERIEDFARAAYNLAEIADFVLSFLVDLLAAEIGKEIGAVEKALKAIKDTFFAAQIYGKVQTLLGAISQFTQGINAGDVLTSTIEGFRDAGPTGTFPHCYHHPQPH